MKNIWTIALCTLGSFQVRAMDSGSMKIETLPATSKISHSHGSDSEKPNIVDLAKTECHEILKEMGVNGVKLRELNEDLIPTNSLEQYRHLQKTEPQGPSFLSFTAELYDPRHVFTNDYTNRWNQTKVWSAAACIEEDPHSFFCLSTILESEAKKERDSSRKKKLSNQADILLHAAAALGDYHALVNTGAIQEDF